MAVTTPIITAPPGPRNGRLRLYLMVSYPPAGGMSLSVRYRGSVLAYRSYFISPTVSRDLTLHESGVRTKTEHTGSKSVTFGKQIRNGHGAYVRAVPSPFATTKQTRPVTPSHRQLNHGSFRSWYVPSSTPCTRFWTPWLTLLLMQAITTTFSSQNSKN
jgi:hypothetical protein